jgi:hypothetical protein
MWRHINSNHHDLRLAHWCVIQEMSAPSINLADVLISQAVSLNKKEENSLRFGATLSKNLLFFFGAVSQW